MYSSFLLLPAFTTNNDNKNAVANNILFMISISLYFLAYTKDIDNILNVFTKIVTIIYCSTISNLEKKRPVIRSETLRRLT